MDNNEQMLRNYLRDYKNMSPDNIEYFISEYSALSDMEKSDLIYEVVGKEIYKENPVNIETFINDPYFLGDIYGGILFNIWKELLHEIYPAPFCKKYDEVILSVATRCFGRGTKIAMFDGSVKNVEDVVVGDKVLGDDETVRNVISLSCGKEQMYKIIPCGDEENFVICNAHHTLPVYSFIGNYMKREVEELYEERKNYSFHLWTIPDYNYLKRYNGCNSSYVPFRIEKLDKDYFYGFELDGNHLFRLANGYVQSNSGKSTVSCISLLYEMYLVTCMINPPKTMTGKASGNLVFAILSKDNATAVSQLGSDIYKGLSMSPYFNGIVRDKLSFSKLDKDGVQITDNILLKAGSSLGTVIGTDLYAGAIDEANMPSPRVALENLVEYRMRIYKEMLDRRSATLSRAPKLSGILWLTSSPTDEGDVLGERIAEVEANAIPNVLIRDNIARWEAREEGINDTFQFFLGSDTKDPCIVDSDLVLKPEEWERVIEVPNTTEYYNAFQINPYHAIQNIAGRRTMPETALFNTVAVFDKVFHKDNYIFNKNIIKLSTDMSLQVDDYLYDRDYFKHPDRPDCFRYIHLDMAYACDKFGLASVYSDRVKYTSDDGHEILRRKYFIDFCLGVVSPNKEKVDIIKVLEFIYALKEQGYPVKLVTTDNHQGELARQLIARKGVKTDYLSIEKDKNIYLNLKNAIITEALEGFKNPELMKELRGLRESQKKIEKGKGYTDDMSDALAGALWSCSQDRFFKTSNEAISEIIKQTGNAIPRNDANIPRTSEILRPGFAGLANRVNQSKNGNNGLGFRYKF